MLAAVIILTASQTISTTTALSGFSNTGLISIVALYFFASALMRSGLLSAFSSILIGRSRHAPVFLARLLAFATTVSVLVANTPLVVVGMDSLLGGQMFAPVLAPGSLHVATDAPTAVVIGKNMNAAKDARLARLIRGVVVGGPLQLHVYLGPALKH